VEEVIFIDEDWFLLLLVGSGHPGHDHLLPEIPPRLSPQVSKSLFPLSSIHLLPRLELQARSFDRVDPEIFLFIASYFIPCGAQTLTKFGTARIA